MPSSRLRGSSLSKGVMFLRGTLFQVALSQAIGHRCCYAQAFILFNAICNRSILMGQYF